MLKLSGYSWLFIIAVCASLLASYEVYDGVYCAVLSGGVADTNGYYSAQDGLYRKKMAPISMIPDFFEISLFKRIPSDPPAAIFFRGIQWDISVLRGYDSPMYVNTPSSPDKYVFNPPSEGWVLGPSGLAPAPSVPICSGELSSASRTQTSPVDNIDMLISRPITTTILVINLIVAYYLWVYRIDASSVSFSYEAVVSRREYWRMITASFSHFDLFHIGFNMLSWYQLGSLEIIYGSMPFLYLNVALVFLTMLICVGFSYVQIRYMNMTNVIGQQAVGFSCVLFAWMVAASVRMDAYCPLFFYPSLCFKTYHFDVPLLPFLKYFPINAGPFALLIVTKLIIPRSSFTGHLSGILIGFPLAWNLLDWLKPMPLALGLSVLCMYGNNLFIYNLPGFETSSLTSLREFLPASQLRILQHLRVAGVCLLLGSAGSFYFCDSWNLLYFTRVCSSVLFFLAYHVVRCLFLSELRSSKHEIIITLITICSLLVVVILCDTVSISAAVFSLTYLVYAGGLNLSFVIFGISLYGLLLIIEIFILVNICSVLQEIPEAIGFVRCFSIDKDSVVADTNAINRAISAIKIRICGNRVPTRSFNGAMFSLVGSSERDQRVDDTAMEIDETSDSVSKPNDAERRTVQL
jgi:membrane associated rhomboid family serine protease